MNEQTPEQLRSALKDHNAPQVVRRYLKQQVFGSTDGRREVNSEIFSSPARKLHTGGTIRSRKVKRPEGMSGRRFKKLRKEAMRVIRAEQAAKIEGIGE